MQTVELEPSPGRPAGDRPLDAAGVTVLAPGPVLVLGPGAAPLAVQFPLAPHVVEPLRAAVRRLSYNPLNRPGGLVSESRTVGYSARMPARGFDACRACTAAADHPDEHRVLLNAAGHIWNQFGTAISVAPGLAPVADLLTETASAIHPAWRMPASPWTSGIVNRSSALTWHRDRNNTPGSWSALVTFRRRMEGGETVVPELGVAFPAADAHVVLMCAAQWWHGVTPLHPTKHDAYRYSIVYYQVGAMRSCLPPAEEQARAATVRRDREQLWADVESGDPAALEAAAAGLGIELAEFLELRDERGRS